jgi:hypothetical protein
MNLFYSPLTVEFSMALNASDTNNSNHASSNINDAVTPQEGATPWQASFAKQGDNSKILPDPLESLNNSFSTVVDLLNTKPMKLNRTHSNQLVIANISADDVKRVAAFLYAHGITGELAITVNNEICAEVDKTTLTALAEAGINYPGSSDYRYKFP